MSKMTSSFPFEIGNLVCTKGVFNFINEDDDFSRFVSSSLSRYLEKDWGEMCEEDKQMNDHAVLYGNERIFASYNEETHGWKLWIITEADHSATTLLLPDEY